MKKMELVNKLNDIYSQIEELEGESVNEMPRAAVKINDKFGEIIQDLEDNGIEPEESEE